MLSNIMVTFHTDYASCIQRLQKGLHVKLYALVYCWSFRHERFSSFDQQDSEEVLRCMLDGIRMEEINVCLYIGPN